MSARSKGNMNHLNAKKMHNISFSLYKYFAFIAPHIQYYDVFMSTNIDFHGKVCVYSAETETKQFSLPLNPAVLPRE